MAVTQGEKLVGAIVFLLEIGGAGIAIAYPQFRPLGFILMVIGAIPLTYWLVTALWHLSVVPRRNQTTKSPNPTLANWADVDPISLTMASFLMTDQVPRTKVDGNPNAHIMFEKLVQAIAQGEVLQYGWTNRQFAQMSYNATYGNTGMPLSSVPKISGKTRVSQSELVVFAQKHELSPIFLRAKMKPDKSDDRLTEKRRLAHIETMAKIGASERTDIADFAAWDRVNELTLRQAAFLWAGERPIEDINAPMSQMAEVVLGELIRDAAADVLQIEPNRAPETDVERAVAALDDIGRQFGMSTARANSRSRVTRSSLQAYALSRKECPPFLYPEMR